MTVPVTQMVWVQWLGRPGEGTGSPGTRVTAVKVGGGEHSNLGPLEEQPVILTDKPSLWLH